MSISHPVSHFKSPWLSVVFSPTTVLKLLPAFDPCRFLEPLTHSVGTAADFEPQLHHLFERYDSAIVVVFIPQRTSTTWTGLVEAFQHFFALCWGLRSSPCHDGSSAQGIFCLQFT